MGMNPLYNHTTMGCCGQENTCGGGMSQVTFVCAKAFVKYHLMHNFSMCSGIKTLLIIRFQSHTHGKSGKIASQHLQCEWVIPQH